MKRVLTIFFVVIFIPIFSVSAHEKAGTNIIHLTSSGFVPQNITISKGESITFENKDTVQHWPASNIHPTHTKYFEFDPKKGLEEGEEWTFTFERVGVWEMHDHLFPEFTGSVTVLEESDKTTLKPSLLSRIVNWLKQIFTREKNTSNNPIQRDRIALHSPTPYTIAQLETEIIPRCAKSDFSCFDKTLQDLTKTYGPNAATELLTLWQEKGIIERSVDDHQLSHRMGRVAATEFGVNSQSFLLCPMQAFNGGCQHGFFEQALGQTDSSVTAAHLICESLDSSYSTKFKFYCYHGVGHGILMAESYDLYSSLYICNQLPTVDAQNGCWQGVFMENVNGGLNGDAREGVFSETDPLAPCNKLEEKYQHECFINHSGWLMKVTNNNITQATKLCLSAPTTFVSSCLQSIGLMVTNPSWQVNFDTVRGNFETTAWTLCTKFPKGHTKECVIGAVDNLLNFDGLNTKRAETFCSIVSSEFKNTCRNQIETNLLNNKTND
jgi:plastocyanin